MLSSSVFFLVHTEHNVTLHVRLLVPQDVFRFGSGGGVHEQYHTRGTTGGGVRSPQAGHPGVGCGGFVV